ncbi:monocarboxylate transporter 6-like [Ostrinia nubilalis]|uniref:monocarboxylate transporter 6-like n=1 Tax=Ostrinia nubilalis TaxID=29057 RepID=UPI00308229D1
MPPKSIAKQTEPRKSILVIPSRIVSRPDELEGGEETEIAAQISVPQEGGWGWVVVFAAFWIMFILDGVSFTFGSLLSDMTADLGMADSLVALINSVAVALYFIAGPLASAFINRFGFRACVMSGSVICAFSLFFSYFSTNYASLVIFYGVCAGFGYCLINMSAGLVVGFYFERLRSLAIALATTGSSAGIMILFPLNIYLVSLAGWRTTTLLHSGMFGLIYYFGMTFRPLLSLTVVKTTDDPTRTVTYLPSLSKAVIQPTQSSAKVDGLKPTVTERLFSAVSNANFPTAAAVVEEGVLTSSNQPGPSTGAVSKLTLTAHSPQGGVSRRHLKQVQSIISKTSVQDKQKRNVELTVHVEEAPKKRSCWARLCHWEEHVPQSRPLYRDDAFYSGKVDKLPIYQKSMMDTTGEGKTGLEYQMAVSRAVTAGDLREKRGVFTTAVRRVLATMMDPKLLKRPSFMLLSASGFLTYVGFLVPYVYLKDRNLQAGLASHHCTLFITVLGFANACGRLAIGALAVKIDPIKLYSISCCIGGLSTIVSDITYDIYYQYGYCVVYGFFVASLACLRSMVIVSLYGLDKLTNATGMMLLFQGFGSLLSTPLAGLLKNNFGYTVSFCVAGAFMVVGGLILIPIRKVANKEDGTENEGPKITKNR